ncbi:MAG: FAD-binding protein [Novosphingobium sp.]
MSEWDESFDFVIVGSGGGSMIAALAVREAGKTPVILEKTDRVGGSTAMSGGVFWIPNHPLQAREGVNDSPELARTYLDAAVGDVGPSTSRARKDMFLEMGPKMVTYLESKGMPFVRYGGWSDYHDDLPGGVGEGRSLGVEIFNLNKLGPVWSKILRTTDFTIPAKRSETKHLTLVKRTWTGKIAFIKLGLRVIRNKLLGIRQVGAGAAIQGRMLKMALDHDVDIRINAAVTDLIEEDGRIVGVLSQRDGRPWRIQARDGVLVNAGGFARSEELRRKYFPQPSSVEWTNANPGDTGEMIEIAKAHGAALDLTNEAVWIPTSVPPDGLPLMNVPDLPKPHLIVVDKAGKRFANEAQSYMRNGQDYYRHGAVPAYAIMDARFFKKYSWGFRMGRVPKIWYESGFVKQADTIAELAKLCGIDPDGLEATVARFNGFAKTGKDLDFKRGDKAYDLVFADHTNKPSATLGPIEEGPFSAIEIYPGDVGTFGGIVTDEFGRAVRDDGSVIPGLYATGNSTASVMGRTYPGAGASISPSFIFGWVAARHAVGQVPN